MHHVNASNCINAAVLAYFSVLMLANRSDNIFLSSHLLVLEFLGTDHNLQINLRFHLEFPMRFLRLHRALEILVFINTQSKVVFLFGFVKLLFFVDSSNYFICHIVVELSMLKAMCMKTLHDTFPIEFYCTCLSDSANSCL